MVWHRWRKKQGSKGKKKKKMKKWVLVGASHGEERLSARGRDWTRHQERRGEDRRCGWKTRRRKGWEGIGSIIWQRGRTYCRAHTHTGPPGTCRFPGRGRGRRPNPWSRCTGSDCCIWWTETGRETERRVRGRYRVEANQRKKTETCKQTDTNTLFALHGFKCTWKGRQISARLHANEARSRRIDYNGITGWFAWTEQSFRLLSPNRSDWDICCLFSFFITVFHPEFRWPPCCQEWNYDNDINILGRGSRLTEGDLKRYWQCEESDQ